MKLTICLSKTVIIFYTILAIPITIGSLHNLVYGVLFNENSTISLGAFSLFGFILLPLLIISSYRNNKCIIESDKISIGKTEYPLTIYSFSIQEKYLPLKDRPIFFLFKKTYHDLIIKEINTNRVILLKELNVFQNDIKKIRLALS
ncbi:hypothetical protein [Flavobacterium phragmitis]|uniref:Uncharacterized protein n=1 Tax=Flavobacterium phragmitis TaxID=739143 RepID=A0A1I1S3I2_9FLAO|nr:hypothetical protein [Flavobacterium phragmitis]SFD39098.1 hypothetical protein SAMN05216297_107214 [Flavobacterium phragmitis]